MHDDVALLRGPRMRCQIVWHVRNRIRDLNLAFVQIALSHAGHDGVNRDWTITATSTTVTPQHPKQQRRRFDHLRC